MIITINKSSTKKMSLKKLRIIT